MAAGPQGKHHRKTSPCLKHGRTVKVLKATEQAQIFKIIKQKKKPQQFLQISVSALFSYFLNLQCHFIFLLLEI